jgi:C4-dicarboxylate transporter, DcuC family
MEYVALIIILLTVIPIARGYQAQATLILAGFLLLITAWLFVVFGGRTVTWFDRSATGLFVFDLFALLEDTLATRVASIGMIIMAAGGFARYMSAIAAAEALVTAAIRPLGGIRNPYWLLAFAYIIGQLLNVFIPSAAGLAMLLLVAMYPTLSRLGARPVAVAAVIGTTACLDLGPASAASNVAATVCGLEPVVYFVRYQIPVALVVIPVIAVLHYVWQKRCDAREPVADGASLIVNAPVKDGSAPPPVGYALLPLLPPIVLILFSPLVVADIQIGVVAAMLLSLFIGMGCEAVRHRSVKVALGGIVHFFSGMGDIFAKVVTLIVAAEIFATGVNATGLISSLLASAESSGSGYAVIMLAFVALIGLATLLTGSGNAVLFSFSGFVPVMAATMGVATVAAMLPAQLATGLFRSMSPVAGVIIAVAAVAGVSPFAIVRRTWVPMLGGVVATLLANAWLTL